MTHNIALRSSLSRAISASQSCSARRRSPQDDGRPGSTIARTWFPARASLAHYDKIQLVPFGEYVRCAPARLLRQPRGRRASAICSPATEQTIFEGKGARLGVLICYESIFPDLDAARVNEAPTSSSISPTIPGTAIARRPIRLLAMAAMRAVETKVPMVRAANTGISAVIEPTGQITARTPLFKRGTEIERVYCGARCERLHDRRRPVRGSLL